MSRFIFTLFAVLITPIIKAQQQSGVVIYTRTSEVNLSFSAKDENLQQLVPKTLSDKFELTFGNNQSVWKHFDEPDFTDEQSAGALSLKMTTSGQNDIVFTDYNTLVKTQQREILDRKYLTTDTIRKLEWKLTGESREILGHTCQKAVSNMPFTMIQTTMENGKFIKKQTSDTTILVAWFTPDIPVSAGPAEMQGQLPGLILSLEMNHGKIKYTAVNISSKVDLAAIKAPAKGKKVSTIEFNAERIKVMEEMQRNQQNNKTVIKTN